MKILRFLLATVAVVVVAGTVASASPPIGAVLGERSTPSASVAPEPSPIEPSAEPTQAETPSPEASGNEEDDDGATAHDFSACVGLRGLENAICRHEALLALDPRNAGLQNSLEHLLTNQKRHEEHAPGHGGGHEGDGSCPGHSCD